MKKLFIIFLFTILVSISFGQDMVRVEGGTFQMGSNDSIDYAARPVHTVTLSSFSMDKYEVTFEKWTEVRTWALAHGYSSSEIAVGWNGDGANAVGTNNPVTALSWYDIVKWCNARSEKEGLTPVYYINNPPSEIYRSGEIDIEKGNVKWTANGYRLPTEAEWEFAARGGKKTKNYTLSGSNTVDFVGWWFDNSGWMPQHVGQKAPNELGIYDMSGNVFERCWDEWEFYTSDSQTDPKGGTYDDYKLRVIRGGSFYSWEKFLRTSFRYEDDTSMGGPYTGFRCVRSSDESNLTITKPTLGETVLAEAPYSIEWNSSGIDSIKIDYSLDDGKTYHKITSGISTDIGSYIWHVPDTLASKCKLVITNLDNPDETAVIENFRIKGYVLTRFDANGDFEAYDPKVHGWQFSNDGSIMWPKDWWERFDYGGIDPITSVVLI